MIISTLFLLTGIVMIANGAVMNTYMYIKIAAVLISIPLAVIGFKKQNKGLAGLAFLLLVTAYGLAEMSKASKGEVKIDTSTLSGDPVTVGKVIYANNCIACHGPGGDLNAAGAKNLRATQLDDASIKTLIRNGKNAMPGYKTLTEEQLDGLVAYVKTLHD
jgi:mono/diheme cytochrome c family protein